MNADLHCHCAVSDGVLDAGALVRRAAANGVAMLALTDHDQLAGLAPAREQAAESGVRFIDGVEISVTWERRTVHVVGLALDPCGAALCAGLAGIREGRRARAQAIAEALAKIGIEGALEGAARHAANAGVIGRTHFARYLVECGVAPDVRSVFDAYLVRGKPGYVAHEWVRLDEAVTWIRAAGGVAVLAHPGRYRIGSAARARLFGQFREAGGIAIEVVSGSHSPEHTRLFARLARRYAFLGSCGSDFHAPGESRCDVGRAGRLPEDVVPVWHLFG